MPTPEAGMLVIALLLALGGCDGDAFGPGEPTLVRGALIHVDGQRGNNQNPGTSDAPFATIGGALENTEGEVTVYVAGGTYREVLRPRSNAHIYGGFDGASWDRTGESTIVEAGSRPARITNVEAVTLDGLELVAASGGRREANSVAVTVHASTAVVISGNVLLAGRGRGGFPGTSQSRPSAASDGGDGEEDAICGTSLNKGGTGGGASTDRGGGAGGDGKWPRGVGGKDGKGPRGGGGGDRGEVQGNGFDGGDGGDGSDGGDGAGGASFGQIIDGRYMPANGDSGENGTHGSGGGGGGGGSGSDGFTCGSAGGGGGQGGARGLGGGGGSGGAGSFGVIVTGGSQVSLTGNRIETVGGGEGGRGGTGAPGGAGGSGGAGGTQGVFGGWDGGDGGDGGSGGRGGNGGGGGGGPSIGIATDGAGDVTYTSNTFQIGPAGAGGVSTGEAGQDGVSAEVHEAG